MRTDLLADGVQCELSTDYHHIVLRNYLVVRRLAAMNRIALPAEMDAHIRRALEFAKWVHRPDGVIPSLSDGDSGSFLDLLIQGHELYGDPEMLYVATAGRQGRAPADRLRAFETAGYYILRSGWGPRDRYADERYLIFDCGPLGAGNHGHLDLLHFEAYAYGRPLIVDPGRYTYHEGDDPNWRAVFRGSGYHNTVTVDGRNQVRYQFDKTRFKIRGPEPGRELRSFFSGDDIDCIHGVCRSHEYEAVHERRIVFVRGEYWIVTDLLTASEPHDYDVWFHLSPEAQGRVAISGDRVAAPFLVIAQPHGSETDVSLAPGFVSPIYGIKQSAPIVRFHRRARNTVFHTVLVPHRGVQPHVAVQSCGDQILITIRTGRQVFCDDLRFDSGSVSFKRQAASPERESSPELLTIR
jgi:heparinase II/III-like protein